MTISLTLTELLLGLLIIAGIVVLVYLAIVLKNLIPTLKSVANITAETEVIVKDVKEKTEGLGDTLHDTVDALGGVNRAIKGNQSVVGATTSLVNAATSLAGLAKKGKRERK